MKRELSYDHTDALVSPMLRPAKCRHGIAETKTVSCRLCLLEGFAQTAVQFTAHNPHDTDQPLEDLPRN